MTTESSPLAALSLDAFAPRAHDHSPPKEARPAPPPAPPPAPADETFASALLDDSASAPARSAQRLLTGAAGAMLLQVATDLAPGTRALHDRLVGPPGLALAAAATLVIGLPGTLILLTALGTPPSFNKAWDALTRAYSQVGLLAGGFAPVVALFALTGGGSELVLVLSFFAYATAGTLALSGLARRVVQSAGEVRMRSFAAGAGFLVFTLAVGLFLWVKLMEAVRS